MFETPNNNSENIENTTTFQSLEEEAGNFNPEEAKKRVEAEKGNNAEQSNDAEKENTLTNEFLNTQKEIKEIERVKRLNESIVGTEYCDQFGLVSLSEKYGLEPTLNAISTAWQTAKNNSGETFDSSEMDTVVDQIWTTLIPDAQERKDTFNTMISTKGPIQKEDGTLIQDDNQNAEGLLSATMFVDENGKIHLTNSGRSYNPVRHITQKILYGEDQSGNLNRTMALEVVQGIVSLTETLNDENSIIFKDLQNASTKNNTSVVTELTKDAETPTLDDFFRKIDEIAFKKSKETIKDLWSEKHAIDQELEQINDKNMDKWWNTVKPLRTVRKSIENQVQTIDDDEGKAFLEQQIQAFKEKEAEVETKYDKLSQQEQDDFLTKQNLPTPDKILEDIVRMQKIEKPTESGWKSLNHISLNHS